MNAVTSLADANDTPENIQQAQWRVMVGDQVYGPYPRARLLEFLEEGRIKAHTRLACGTDETFNRADEHPNLRWDFTNRTEQKTDSNAAAQDTAAPVCNYFISARILAEHAPFERQLNQVGKFARAGSDMWVLRSRETLPQLRKKLADVLRKDESCAIVNATTGRLAWVNLGAEHDVAIRSIWNSELNDESDPDRI